MSLDHQTPHMQNLNKSQTKGKVKNWFIQLNKQKAEVPQKELDKDSLVFSKGLTWQLLYSGGGDGGEMNFTNVIWQLYYARKYDSITFEFVSFLVSH